MLSAINPGIPFEGTLSGAVRPGFSVFINGTCPSGPYSSFAIKLTTGQQRPGFPEPTIAFHFSPQFGANAVVRNTYQVPAGWGPEERSGVLPFIRGANFQVQITAEPYEFKVLVNGVFFCSYKYRIPINQIRALGVTGEVKIHQIHCQSGQGTVYPTPPPPPPYTPYPSPQTSAFPLFVTNPTIPVNIHIPGNMQSGMNFSISGVPYSTASGFSFNWKCQNGDNAFHFNPRFKENVVVRNTLQKGNWGPEERAQSWFPFSKNASFHVHVQCLPNYYDVKVNGQSYTTYNHRIYPLNIVDTLNIQGDVVITNVGISY